MKAWWISERRREGEGARGKTRPPLLRRFASLTRSEALAALRLADSPHLTREDATEAFRRRAKSCHPDVAGGSTRDFQLCVSAVNALAEVLPTAEELLRLHAAHVQERNERRFSAQGGRGSLLAAPRGVLHKTFLVSKQLLSERLMSAKSKVADAMVAKLKSSARPVEATGDALATLEELELGTEEKIFRSFSLFFFFRVIR